MRSGDELVGDEDVVPVWVLEPAEGYAVEPVWVVATSSSTSGLNWLQPFVEDVRPGDLFQFVGFLQFDVAPVLIFS